MEQTNELPTNELKLRCINNGSSNKLSRVSLAFKDKLEKEGYINERRKDRGFKELSGPKITELIIRHKLWKTIEEDIIGFSLGGE